MKLPAMKVRFILAIPVWTDENCMCQLHAELGFPPTHSFRSSVTYCLIKYEWLPEQIQLSILNLTDCRNFSTSSFSGLLAIPKIDQLNWSENGFSHFQWNEFNQNLLFKRSRASSICTAVTVYRVDTDKRVAKKENQTTEGRLFIVIEKTNYSLFGKIHARFSRTCAINCIIFTKMLRGISLGTTPRDPFGKSVVTIVISRL